jgi:hypothetical protein
MIAKLVVEGKEFDIEILDPKLQELIAPKKKTGYERVKENNYYWIVDPHSQVYCLTECDDVDDENLYNLANYYESEVVAGRNARADTLMRQLRRFAVEHRTNDKIAERYYIYYLRDSNMLQLRRDTMNSFIGPWFDNQHAGAQAIETFKDELIWYFTEYRDSL